MGPASDWKTAVFILPFTQSFSDFPSYRLEDCRIYTSFYYKWSKVSNTGIGRLPYLYFLLLKVLHTVEVLRLEDCRIYTSFYCRVQKGPVSLIGRLPYLYFLLL